MSKAVWKCVLLKLKQKYYSIVQYNAQLYNFFIITNCIFIPQWVQKASPSSLWPENYEFGHIEKE